MWIYSTIKCKTSVSCGNSWQVYTVAINYTWLILASLYITVKNLKRSYSQQITGLNMLPISQTGMNDYSLNHVSYFLHVMVMHGSWLIYKTKRSIQGQFKRSCNQKKNYFISKMYVKENNCFDWCTKIHLFLVPWSGFWVSLQIPLFHQAPQLLVQNQCLISNQFSALWQLSNSIIS